MKPVLIGALVVYSLLFGYLMLWRIDLSLARREARQARRQHDLDEQARLKGIREGTWQ